MTVRELVGRIVVYGGLAIAGYYIYQFIYTEPITRASESRNPDNVSGDNGDSLPNLDDCQRYINTESIQACIEARSSQ